MKKGIKKALCGIFLTAFAACTTLALGAASIPEAATAKAATDVVLMTDSYGLVGTSVRVINGDYSANALRYHTQMTPAELKNYAQTDADGNILLNESTGTALLKDGVTTGVLLLPTHYLGTTDLGEVNELLADATYSKSVANVSTTLNWTPRVNESGVIEYYEANVVLTGIPQSNHSNTVSARAYVKSGEEYEYTDQKDTASMTNVAYAVYTDSTSEFYQDQNLKEAYLDKKIRFYKNGGTYEEEIVTYGETIPEKMLEEHGFQGWHDKDMEHFHFSETTVTGNVKLYAIYEQNVETAGTNGSSIDVSAYTSNGYEIADIVLNDPTLGTVNLGSNPNSLSLPSSVTLGDARIAVTFTNGKTLDMPATVVTKMIRTPEDLLALQALDKGTLEGETAEIVTIEGYYKLACDISLLNASDGLIFSNTYYESNWSSAFKGTLDGAGYTIKTASTYLGFFCDVNEALIKDVVFEDCYYRGGQYNSILGRSLQSSTLNNVDFVITYAPPGYADEADDNIGLITTQKCWDNTFIDVVIRSEVENLHLISLFGGNSNQNQGFVNNTFENCFVQVHRLNEVGANGIQGQGNVLVDYIVEKQGAGSLTYQGAACETHEFTRLVKMTYEDKVVCNKCGAVSTYYDKTVLTADRYINVTESNALDLNGIGEYTSIKSISFEKEAFEVSLDSLTVPQSIQDDVTKHGVQTLSVVVEGTDGFDHTISVPVILVTKEFTSLSDLLSTVRYTTDYENGKIYGYYTLGADLVQGNESILTAKYNWNGSTTEDAYCGFYGTLDGRGHSITIKTSGVFGCGIFGTTYDATIKNLTVTNTNFNGGWGQSILAHTMYGTRLENVVLNITGGNGTSETENGALISGALAGAPSGAVSRWVNVEINSSVNVGYLIAGLADSTKFSGCTFNGLSYKAIGGGKTTVDGITINATLGECVHTNEWDTSDASVDKLICTACGVVAQEFDKSVDVKDRYILLTDSNAALDLAGVSDGTIVSISDGTYSYGTDVSALTFEDALTADLQNHGAKILTVTIATEDGVEHAVSVPVILVTKEFTTFKEMMDTVRYTESNTQVYGYYTLGADLKQGDGTWTASKAPCAWDTQNGFHGTFDGRGRSVEINTSAFDYGIFGMLYAATVKNVTITNVWYSGGGGNAMLAHLMYATRIENVDLIVRSGNGTRLTTGGVIASGACASGARDGISNYGTALVNVNITSNVNLGYLFGGYSKWTAYTNCTFTSLSYVGLGAHYVSATEKELITTASGLTIDAPLECQHTNKWYKDAADVDVYKCSLCGVVEKEFDKSLASAAEQYVILTGGSSLDLSGIGDYVSVSSIAYGSYTFGDDLSSLTAADATLLADVQNHGAGKTLSVTVVDESGEEHIITVPVILVTAEFTDFVTFVETVRPKDKTADVYGYYTLGQNIENTEYAINGADTDTQVVDGETIETVRSYAFKGVFDGKGYSITANTENYRYGIFGVLNRATIKNVTITTTAYGTNTIGNNGAGNNKSYYNAILAYSMNYTTLTNVTVNVTSEMGTAPADGRGMLVTNGASSNTFTNVDINVTGTISYLFKGYGASTYTDCTLTVTDGTYENMAMGWNTETEYDVVDGLTINGTKA